MGQHLGMNGHERLALEGELRRTEASLFLALQHGSILRECVAKVAELRTQLPAVVPLNHSARRTTDQLHGLIFFESQSMDQHIRDLQIRRDRISSQLAQDDALIRSPD